MCNRYFQLLTIGLIVIGLVGCRGNSPVAPDEQGVNPGVSANKYASNNFLWGLWDVSIDPDTGDIDAVPLRTADFNANVVKFLQPPIAPVHMLTIALGPGSEPSTGYWVIDITLKHPFPEYNIFRGFDVRGIIVTEGDAVGIHDTSVRYSGLDGTRLLNADGYTRWWNMQEFTSYGTIFGYTEGARSTPGFEATATVNPYKLFTDALDEEAPLVSMDHDMRATFGVEPGIATRRYKIQFAIDSGVPVLKFKYAVDASWSLPDPAYAPDYPVEAYDLSANCQEPYLVDVPIFEQRPFFETTSSYGGDAVFLLTIGDWQADSGENVIDQISHIWVESPTLIDAPLDVHPYVEFVESTHATMATYRVTVPGCHPTGLEDQYFFISVESAAPDSYVPQIQGDPYAFEWPDAELGAYKIAGVPINIEAPFYKLGWAKHAGGPETDYGNVITSLSDGSTVITGSYEGVATFGEDEPNETVLNSHGYTDAFIARYNPDGMLVWAKGAGGLDFDLCWGITSLSDDSIILAGGYKYSAIFGEGEPNETILESDSVDMFIARYNPDGTLAWVKRQITNAYSLGFGIDTLTNDSVVIVGHFTGTAIFGEGEPNETALEGDSYEIFIAEIKPDGSLAWATKAGGPGLDMGSSIAALSDNSATVTGVIEQSATFGEGEPHETVINSYGLRDIFIARYNTDGTVAWAKQAGGTDLEAGLAIAALSDDSSVVTGDFMGSAIFGEGESNETVLVGAGYDIFIARYNPNGTLVWAKRAGGQEGDLCDEVRAFPDDSFIITGDFMSTAIFGEGESNQTSLISKGHNDIFLARYNQDGTLAWVLSAGGAASDSGYSVTILPDTTTVLTGSFTEASIFGEGEANETVLHSYGEIDIFIARYLP